jgi:hypothetical protein
MDNQKTPGLLLPTVSAPLGNSDRQSAIIAGNETALKMNRMNNELAGGKRRKYRIGGSNSKIVVPQFQMSYTPQNGPGQDPNAQIKNNAIIGTQAAANSVYDSQALKFGGSNPDWVWGCSSGGKRRQKKTTKKRRTHKKRNNKGSRTLKKNKRYIRK